jgi:peptidoglycan/LPS O-acetylase OafA/YrhL
MVIAVHTSHAVGNIGRGCFDFEFFGRCANKGARGVQLFFLLSAFTLFASSHERFMTELSPKRDFYIRRVFRILPLWWLIILIFSLKDNWTFPQALPSIFMYFGFIRFMPHSEVHPIGWTIFVEVTFYILLPLIFTAITNLRRSIIFLIITTISAKLWLKYAQSMGVPEANNFITMFPLAQWYCFAGGIVLYFIQQTYGSDWIRGIAARILEISIVSCFLIFFFKGHFWATLTLGMLFLACMSPKTIFGKISRIKILQQFGVCCYSIYLLHPVVLQYSEPLKTIIFNSLNIEHSSVDIRFCVWFPLVSGMCLISGLFIFYLVEKPSVNLGKKVILLLENRPPS